MGENANGIGPPMGNFFHMGKSTVIPIGKAFPWGLSLSWVSHGSHGLKIHVNPIGKKFTCDCFSMRSPWDMGSLMGFSTDFFSIKIIVVVSILWQKNVYPPTQRFSAGAKFSVLAKTYT